MLQHLQRALPISGNDPQRIVNFVRDTRRQFRHLIEYTTDGSRVYFLSYKGGLYRSDNGGSSFQGPLGLKDVGASEIRVDPQNKDLVWVAAEDGLYLSRNAGSDFTKIESMSGPVSPGTCRMAPKPTKNTNSRMS